MRLQSWRRYILALVLTQAAAFAGSAFAHNGVRLEQDTCVVKVGPVSVHFIAYQTKGEPEEFCDDIAGKGQTVVALSLVEPPRGVNSYYWRPSATDASAETEVDMRSLAIGVRIVRDIGEDKAKADIDAATELYLPPQVYKNGTLTLQHDFKVGGRYVAIITVADDRGNEWSSRFPFGVGLYSLWNEIEYVLYAIAFLSLAGILWFATRRRGAQGIETAKA